MLDGLLGSRSPLGTDLQPNLASVFDLWGIFDERITYCGSKRSPDGLV